MSWTLTYFPPPTVAVPAPAPVVKDFEAWGLSQLVGEFETFTTDKCTFTAPAQPVDADLLFAKKAWVVITHPDGSIYFRGIVGKTPRRASGKAESVQYEIWGPWCWLTRLPFQMQWYSTNGIVSVLITTTKSRIIVGQNIDGTKMHLGQMMTTVLNYLLAAAAAYVDPVSGLPAPFVPFQIGLMTPDTIVPFIEVKDMFCDQLIKSMAKFVPSLIQRVDYRTTPPTMHFSQRAGHVAVALPILATSGLPIEVTDWDIDSRDDLLVTAVIAKYEETNVIDGVSLDCLTVDKFPLTAPDNGFDSLVTTVDLVGGREAFQKQPVTVKEIPTSAASVIAAPWVIKRLKWMTDLGLDTAHISVDNIVISLDPDDPAATAPPAGFSLGALTQELISGTVSDWMATNDGVFAATILMAVTLSYAGTAPGTAAYFSGGSIVKYFKIKATNAATQTYEELTDWSLSEPVPVGMAQAMQSELSVLHFDGHIETTEVECSRWINLGNTFNTTDGRPEWRTMNAALYSITENIDTGITKVKLGPPRTLNLHERVELLRALRGLLPSFKLNSRTDAITPGVKVQGSNHAPQGTIDGPPMLPQAFPFQVVSRITPGSLGPGFTFQAMVLLNSNLLKSQNLYDTIAVTGLNTWFPLDANDTGWLLGTVTALVASGPTIHSFGQGHTDYDPAALPWTAGGIVENDSATPPNQTLFRRVIFTSVPDSNGQPVITQKTWTDLVTKNTPIAELPAIYPMPL
jgi:hypothetical protein